jgi:hypothetical protein
VDTLANRFKGADLRDLPSLAAMPDDRRKSLWLMLVGRERLDPAVRLTPHEISVVLRDAYGIAITRQRVTSLFASERAAVAHRRRGGQVEYQLMESGAAEVLASGPDVVFIEPDTALTGIRTIESLLGSLAGTVRVVDPYVDGRTLDLLATCTSADEIRLLTANIAKPAPFLRDMEAFRREHKVPIQVVQVSPGVLHDRYAIYDDGMVLFGTSLNGIGKKQTFVVALGPDMRSLALAAFEREWAAGTTI